MANTGLMALLGLDAPPIQLERTLTIILIVHVFYNYAVALRIITGFWANQNPRMEEAARVLGSRGWRVWWEIRLPLLRPAILAAAALVFIFTFTSFGVVLILGGPRFATVEVEISTGPSLNLPIRRAVAGADRDVRDGGYTGLQRRNAAAPDSRLPATQWVGGWVRAPSWPCCFRPLLALVIRSFTIGTEDSFRITGYWPNHATRKPVPPARLSDPCVRRADDVSGARLGLITATLLSRVIPARWLDPFMLPPTAR
jgi:thiamine transport system permease protein